MEYKVFQSILNKQIFESSKRDLLEKITNYPERYIGLFRPTKPKAKILQNLLQSNEIRFGDALEIIFEKYFEQLGFTILPKKIEMEKEYLDLDQLFKDNNYIYFVEQKVRDDHDSTKKRGQLGNFEKKISALIKKYDETKLKCFTYFIDPSLTKNKKYYTAEIAKINSDYNVSVKLCYGKEFWDEIVHPEIWDELLKHLEKWKREIPDMPSINFDDDDKSTFEEIRCIEVSVFRKLFNNRDICKEILPILFPENKSLELLHNFFSQQKNKNNIYKTLSDKIKEYIITP
ncbi:HpyAIV family type II restriction enzyme [Treponema sp. R80B11-R83G3]